jgi:hypothetical protein
MWKLLDYLGLARMPGSPATGWFTTAPQSVSSPASTSTQAPEPVETIVGPAIAH